MPTAPITVNSQKIMDDQIFLLRKKKMDFTVTETTGTVEVTYTVNGRQQSTLYILDVYDNPNDPLEERSDPSLIRNICRAVKNDVKKYLKSNPMPEYDWDRDFITMDWDHKMISTMIMGDIVHEIDINSCYWTLAFQKRFISQKTYLKYLPYKKERLIALGNLAKVKYIKQFFGGRQKMVTKDRSYLAPFFFSIICDTYKIYKQINTAIDRKCYYFKTDAVIVPPSIHIENKVRAELHKHGMECKVNRYRVKEIGTQKILLTNMVTKEDKMIYLVNYS